MSYLLVKPLGEQLLQLPPNRPDKSSPLVKAAKRNLFGSSPADCSQIDSMLSDVYKHKRDNVKARYKIDITEIEEKRAAKLPYARIEGIKSIYRVRKTVNGNSNVPKRLDNPNINNNNDSNNKNNNNNNNNNNNDTTVGSHSSEIGTNKKIEEVPQKQEEQQEQ